MRVSWFNRWWGLLAGKPKQDEEAVSIAAKALGVLMPAMSAEDHRRLTMLGSSPELFKTIADGRCPACRRRTRFITGPVGGMSVNIMCDVCHYWFNVSPIGIAEAIGYKGEREYQ